MNKKENNIQFQLIDITTEQFAVFEENYEQGNYEFGIDLQFRVSISSEQKAVGIFTKFSFLQSTNLVLALECGCHFQIENDYWNANIKNNSLTLDKDLLTHFLLLTVGTTRGVLHAKKPKWSENLMLPTINVTSIIQKNMSFYLEDEDNIVPP